MQGQNDPQYESIIKAISGIIFLATPHRGTHLAETLNRILQSTMITNPKQYISELAKNSLTLQRLNEQFRHIAPRLEIVSFYETRATSIIKNIGIMILEKDSSVLGYPGETSKALDADHHGVCKYDSPNDPNYIAVRNALMSLLKKVTSPSSWKGPTLSSRKEPHSLKPLLTITEGPTIDYSFFRDQWAHGTCEWILQDEMFVEWLQTPDTMSSLLWLNGKAGTGKSVLASFIINNLAKRGCRCQYFFIRFGDQKKRALSSLLRSIAHQIAQVIPDFSQKLLEVIDEGIDYETADHRTIWERIFKSILFTIEERSPLYWIVDGVDEAHDPRATMRLLSDIPYSCIPLRILIVSRRSSEIGSAFQKLPSTLNPRMISIEGHLEDLQCYVRQELSMPGSSEFKEDIVKRVVEGSQNNFLWVRLAVDKLNMCHRLADVEAALQELPTGMEALYDRMAASVAQNQLSTNRNLALSILQCVTCSLRDLKVTELSQAMDEDISDFLDLERSIVDLCGGFVVIDNGGNVTMIHHTAREYLLSDNNPFHVDPSNAHGRMFLNCMKCLMAVGLRAKANRNQKPGFVDYASNWWSSHLTLSSPDCEQIGEVLKRFLTSHYVLTWIHILAGNNQQRVLIQASQDLSNYCLERQVWNEKSKDNPNHTMEQDLIESWSTDFVKLVGKFGKALRRNPEAIYKLIPPFCPQNSSIYRIFGKGEAKSIAISGVSTENWDDSVARLSLGSDRDASSIRASGSLVCVLVPPGNVFIYDSSTFEEATVSPIKHGEWVERMELNSTASLLATYGYRTTKIWETRTGHCKVSVDNIESRSRVLDIQFTKNSNALIVGNEDRRIRSLDLGQQSPTWQLLAELEELGLDGHSLHSSSHIALNRDRTLVAAAHPGYPLSAWELDGPVYIDHCRRNREGAAIGEVVDAVWHPYSPELLGLYLEGIIFKWQPYEGKTIETPMRASRLAISRDGKLLGTGGAHGIVQIYATSNLGLLYQLRSQDIVLGLAFSPDNRRFYDIRGHYASVWEPNALMKFAEQADRNVEIESEIGSFTHSLSTYSSSSRRIDSITVLAASPAGRLYSYGTETGTVHLVNAHMGKLVDTYTPKGFLSIEQMSWSNDGRYVCFSDTGKRVFIRSVTLDPGTSEPTVKTIAEIRMKNLTKGPIIQLLFQHNSKNLLVISSITIHAISLATLSVTNSVELDTAELKWIVHPQDPELIIGFGSKRIRILGWNLEQIQSHAVNFEGLADHAVVHLVLTTQDKKHLLVQASFPHNLREKTLYYFETLKFSAFSVDAPSVEQNSEAVAITPITLPRDVSTEIALPLSFNPHGSLVFLSRNFSVCSWKIPPDLNTFAANPTPSPSRSVAVPNPKISNRHKPNAVVERQFKELFSLPGDWISRDCLYLCTIWGVEKSFLCPRNGEVAVVRCAALV
ncbi:hypothetical protein F5Y06DRAFT_138814 [Hypoxylon sp. FL0890]|nr:hypothetical protein F5Y06DRAFT_138814 [Hypoxylon sp. FL0890]